MDCSCWPLLEELNAEQVFMDMQHSLVSGEKSDDPLSPGYVPKLFAHTWSPAKKKAVGDMSRYRSDLTSMHTH